MDGRTMAYPTNMAHISSIMVFTRWGRKKRNRWAAPLVQRLRAIGENLEDKQRNDA